MGQILDMAGRLRNRQTAPAAGIRAAIRFGACIFTAATALFSLMLAPVAHGQSYPSRAIKIVVPAAAGGALDLVSRTVAERIADRLGQTVYVENKPGANWIIGMEHVARSEPDGYTLLLVSGSGFSINPHLFKNVPSVDEFAPIVTPTKGTFVLLVSPKLGVGSIQDFIKLLKDRPGQLNHASNSATTKVLSEFFKLQAQVDYRDVSYRGASLAINDTMIGNTDFCFVDFGSATSMIQEKLVRPLGTTSKARYELSPDIPALAEIGMPDFAVDGGTVLLAPAKVPTEIIVRLNRVIADALRSPDLVQRFRAIGQVPADLSPEQTRVALQSEITRWSALIRQRNIKLN